MVLSDTLVADIFQTLNQMQSLLSLQQKTIAPLIERIQAEAAAQQQQRQTGRDTDAAARHNGGGSPDVDMEPPPRPQPSRPLKKA